MSSLLSTRRIPGASRFAASHSVLTRTSGCAYWVDVSLISKGVAGPAGASRSIAWRSWRACGIIEMQSPMEKRARGLGLHNDGRMNQSHLDLLFEFLRFASVSTDPARAPVVHECACWLGEQLIKAGL